MQKRTLKRVGLLTLTAALIGFSSLGLAQSKAIEALDTPHAAAVETTPAPQRSMANSLAADLDAYNQQATAGRVPGDRLPADNTTHHMADSVRDLSQDLDAYNSNATAGRVPETHMPANAAQPDTHPQAQALAAELNRYNDTGGSLASIDF